MKQRFLAFLGLWIPLALIALALVAGAEFVRVRDGLERDGGTLHRILSQRVDQHDAHLTSLAAVLASSGASSATFQAVVEAMQRFYPRIAAVALISFTGSSEMASGSPPAALRDFEMAALAERLRELGAGQAGTVASRTGTPFYALVKRLPDNASEVGALVLVIDGKLLVEPEGGLPHEIALVLRDGAGTVLVQTGATLPHQGVIPRLSYEGALGSRSQPLVLHLAGQPVLADLLPPRTAFVVLTATGLAAFLLLVILRERRRTAGAREAMRLHQHEARLAHAMRVNTVGEMASGIAHEITQPLTAILSQSQAGLRLARSEAKTPDELVGVLEANVRHARRAGEILERLRTYVSRRDPVRQPADLNQITRNVVELVQRDLQERAITLRLELSSIPPWAVVDRVSIEQVVHNLVRNAAEALDAMPEERRVITITVREVAGEAEISVADQGSGIADADMARLFEPFFTTKSGGMGLGLPLCERLVESAGGRIEVRNGASSGAVFTIRLPAWVAERKVAAE
ncbi:sensor histidine kinase [Bosea sp. BIWAKO-01]|uniref:sensor histidine kinase n=1 Tax=Bosea sp. BIWAKO-01 TaxID=506668 RepID=UPI000868BE77|nr:ATP-binding protein [Bosea sp. BIWAKO-01]GAU81424.1 two-component hybrid sensor and regulator [Bosea sp. BIWAKO-01]